MILFELYIQLKSNHSLEWEEQEYYLAAQRKFYINSITPKQRLLLELLKDDTKFSAKYFTNTIISSADNE